MSRGEVPREVLWETCGVRGGAPAQLAFCIDNHRVCTPSCDSGSFVDLQLFDSNRDGWDGGYYSVINRQGRQLAGGTLSEVDGSDINHPICVSFEENGDHLTLSGMPPPTCVYVYLEQLGSYPQEISFGACGVVASSLDILQVCVSRPGGAAAGSGSGSGTGGSCSAVVMSPNRGNPTSESPASACASAGAGAGADADAGAELELSLVFIDPLQSAQGVSPDANVDTDDAAASESDTGKCVCMYIYTVCVCVYACMCFCLTLIPPPPSTPHPHSHK